MACISVMNPNPLGCVQNRIEIGGFGTVRVLGHKKKVSGFGRLQNRCGDTLFFLPMGKYMIHTRRPISPQSMVAKRGLRNWENVHTPM